jgi:hypothetical protein
MVCRASRVTGCQVVVRAGCKAGVALLPHGVGSERDNWNAPFGVGVVEQNSCCGTQQCCAVMPEKINRTQGDGMKKPLGLALLVLSIVMTSIPAHAEVLQPARVFTLRDLNSDGSVDAFDEVPPRIGVPSFWGFVSRLPGFTDETFVEFDISNLSAASQATLGRILVLPLFR